MEFRLGSEQRVCGQGDVIVIPGGTEHEAWFREDTEVIDSFAPPRDDFLLGGKPAYISEGCQTGRSSQSGAVANTSRCADPVARLEPRAMAPFPGRAGMQAITLRQRTTRRLNSPSTPGQRIHPKRDLLRP
jgi:hypothetical protein